VANRLELEDLAALQEHLAAVNARPEVLVLRLTATGRHFCSGFNISRIGAGSGAGPNEDDAGARFEALADALEQARPVTIAALQGGVYGGAGDLALACDFRYGTPACELRVPAAQLGLHYYRGGLQRYVARLGLQAAKRVMLTAETFDAPALLACGLLDRVVTTTDGQADAPTILPVNPSANLPADAHTAALMTAVDTLSATLAGMAPLALLGMKKHLNRMARGPLGADDLADIAADIARAAASDDLREGTQAWQDKRRPVFHGR
jgi:enoyl-CoA hydratase/carnithine racemase